MGGGNQSRGRRRQEQRGEDLKYEISIDLREAYTGVKKEISFDTLVTCDACDGTGSSGRTENLWYVWRVGKNSGFSRVLYGCELVRHGGTDKYLIQQRM